MLLKSLVTLLVGGGFVEEGCEGLTALPHLLQKLASSGSLLPQFKQNMNCLLCSYDCISLYSFEWEVRE